MSSKKVSNGHQSDTAMAVRGSLSNEARNAISKILKNPLALDNKQELEGQILEMLDLRTTHTELAPHFQVFLSASATDLSQMPLEELRTKAVNLRVVLLELKDDQIGILAGPNTDLVKELNNIDFAKLVGAPLQAAVDAQAAASISSIDFIKEVGFEQDENGNPTAVRYVDFVYDEKTGEVDEQGNEKTVQKNLKVPLLSMVTIPSLRIETVDVNFNAKLNSVESRNVSNKLGINASARGGFGPVKFKVSASYQRSSSTGVKVEKQYTMNVKVKATQDEMPAGLEMILNLLAN